MMESAADSWYVCERLIIIIIDSEVYNVRVHVQTYF